MIHLKVRTEYSFGAAYAPVEAVVGRLMRLGVTAAGCVDAGGGTWGHVAWEAGLTKHGITPMFGAEWSIVDRLEGAATAPTAWALAQTPAALYEIGATAHAQAKLTKFGRPTLTRDQFLAAEGLVKFAGGAFTDPSAAGAAADAGVIFDISPASPLLARSSVASARRTGGRMTLVGDNFYPSAEDRKVFELAGRPTKPTPQHILTAAELVQACRAAGGMTEAEAVEAAIVAEAVAELLAGVKLARAPLIKVSGDVAALCREGQRKRLAAGQIAEWTPEYEERLLREIALVRDKEFDSYFLVVADMIAWAKERMLVGPARGSSAGSLMCYLMGITEVDPLPYGLMFERFVDVTRKDLPDIDVDFPDTQRDLVYGYLRDKYGAERVARIGTISEYKPKSAIAEVAKRLGIPPWETQGVKDAMYVRSSGDSRVNNCLTDTLQETEPGRALVAKFPAIALSGQLEGHASHSGVHAAGVIVCNEPVHNFCTVADGVAQITKVDAEALNLLKIDALGLRTLSVIEDAGVIGREEIYRLKFDDPAIFKVLNDGRFSGIFQWEGQALQSLTRQIEVKDFETMAHITALARPGPLGGGAAGHFTKRKRGEEAVDVAHPSMLPYLAESYGLVLYQEQVMRIVREIGQFSWDETSTIRKAMSGRKGKEFFDRLGEKFCAGAETVGLNKREALAIWDQINSMGAWAFNKSHSVSYAIVSYWTAWLKAHHPLQYAAAVLRNAKDDESAMITLREICSEGVPYIPFDAERSGVQWTVVDGTLIGGFMSLRGVGAKTAAAMVAARAKGSFTPAQLKKLATAQPIFQELYPARAMWRDHYENPTKVGIRAGSRVLNISELTDGEVLFIGQLRSKDSRDYNEAVRLAKRNGKRMRGQTLFLDMRVTDDSTLTPLLCRVDRFDYEPIGRTILERGREDYHWFLIRGEKLPNFPMVQVHKIKCLNDPDLLKG